MKIRELSLLMAMASAFLLLGCQKSNTLSVEERAKLMAEEVKADQKQCENIRSKFLLGTHSELDLTVNFQEAKKLHCLYGDI